MVEGKYRISSLLNGQNIYNEMKTSYENLKAFALLINLNALPSNYLPLSLRK